LNKKLYFVDNETAKCAKMYLE